jgi:RNA polymerase primary sigma factor
MGTSSTTIGRARARPKDKKWRRSHAEADAVERIAGDWRHPQEPGMSLTEFRRLVNMVQKGEREARIAKKEMGRGQSPARHLHR